MIIVTEKINLIAYEGAAARGKEVLTFAHDLEVTAIG